MTRAQHAHRPGRESVASTKINATVRRECRCYRCGRHLSVGDRVYAYRERATCYAEARSRGTLYPQRTVCAECAAK